MSNKNLKIEFENNKININKLLSNYNVEFINQIDSIDYEELYENGQNCWVLESNNDNLILVDLREFLGVNTTPQGDVLSGYKVEQIAENNYVEFNILKSSDNTLLVKAGKNISAYLPDSDLILDYQQVNYFAVNRLTNQVIPLNEKSNLLTRIEMKEDKEYYFRNNELDRYDNPTEREEGVNKEFDENTQFYLTKFNKNNKEIIESFNMSKEQFNTQVNQVEQKFIENFDTLTQQPLKIMKDKTHIKVGKDKINIEEFLDTHIPSPVEICDYQKDNVQDYRIEDNTLFIEYPDFTVSMENSVDKQKHLINYDEYCALSFKNIYENKDIMVIKSSDFREIMVNDFEEVNVNINNVNYFTFDKSTKELKSIAYIGTANLENSPTFEYYDNDKYQNLNNDECDKLWEQRTQFIKNLFFNGENSIIENSSNLNCLDLNNQKLNLETINKVDKYIVDNIDTLKLSLNKSCSI